MDKYKGGFSVRGKDDLCTVEWLYDSGSDERGIRFMAYDANLCPLPLFSKWNGKKWKDKQIKRALDVTKDFDGEVWLDDEKIRGE